MPFYWKPKYQNALNLYKFPALRFPTKTHRPQQMTHQTSFYSKPNYQIKPIIPSVPATSHKTQQRLRPKYLFRQNPDINFHHK